jgi:GNAT superfamily N-acetyltransferase
MNYRSATPDDAAIITAFQIAMALETEELALDGEICRRGVDAVFARPELGRYFIAEDKGKVAGCLMTTYEWSDWRNGMVWWIQSVYVDHDFRRRGVYAGLYQHLKSLAEQEEGVRGIRLYVDRRNVIAQQVYTRLGMDGQHYQLFEWMKGS